MTGLISEFCCNRTFAVRSKEPFVSSTAIVISHSVPRKGCSRHSAHILTRMCCIQPGVACSTTGANSFRLLLVGGRPPCSLQAAFRLGTDQCSSSLCEQAPTPSCVSKFSAATLVGAKTLTALYEQPVFTKDK